MQRVWTEPTCPFSPFSLAKNSTDGVQYGRKYLVKGRRHFGGWRFIPKQVYRSSLKLSTLYSNDDASGSDASASSSSSPAASPVTDSTPVSRKNGKKRKENGKSSSSSREGRARAKTAKLFQ